MEVNNDNKSFDEYLLTIPDFELEKCSYDSINYGYGVIDNDYINWKYKYPNTNDKVVVLNDDAISSIEIYDELENDEHRYSDYITFQISNWKNLNAVPLARLHFFAVLVFPNDTNNLDILDCVKHFVINRATNRFRLVPDGQIFTNNVIDYTKMIHIDMSKYQIYNTNY